MFKRFFVAFVALLFAFVALAAPPPPTASQQPANILTALALGWVVSFGAIVTGTVPGLCARLRGTYTPGGYDLCPDGQWRYLFTPAPTPQ